MRGARPRPDVLIGTLGKAFGGAGSVRGRRPPRGGAVRNRARSYVFSTAPSPALARAAEAATRLVRDADDLRVRLRRHWTRLREGLGELGYQVLPGDSPIIPIMVGEPGPTMALSHASARARGVRARDSPPDGAGRYG